MRKLDINKILFALFMFFFCLVPVVKAEESTKIVDFNKNGSIRIVLTEREENTAIEGVELGLYHIANVSSKDYNLHFEYTEKYQGCLADLSDLTIEGLTDEIIQCTKNQEADFMEKTSQDGEVNFTDLKLGLYLVKQENQVKGYSKIDSYLVMLPELISNNWTYDVVSKPKTEIYKTVDISVIKKWNKQNEKNKVPEYVTIELLKDNEVIDTVRLSDDNNWKYTWADLEKSDKYDVREINIPKGYKASYKNDGYTFTVTNTDDLPNTGQLYYSIIVLAVLGMIFILLGFVQMRRGN